MTLTANLMELREAAEAAKLCKRTIDDAYRSFSEKATPSAILALLALVEAQGWISVEDRLPAPYTDILLTISTGEVVMGCMGPNFWDWPETDKELEADYDVDVTHWRALPAPPSKEADHG